MTDITDQPEQHVDVTIAPRSGRTYPVKIGSFLEHQITTTLENYPELRSALAIIDDELLEGHQARILKAIENAGVAVSRTTISANERTKSIQTVARLLEHAADAQLDRHSSFIVGFGGGITTDIAGFVAATYQRGIPVLQLPTTLLSMVDASTGGKTGVNLDSSGRGLLKNYVGAFHQPLCVFADIQRLSTLPDRHLRSGLAECIKHALLAKPFRPSSDSLVTLEERIAGCIERDSDHLIAMICEGVRTKSAVVEHDETERSKNLAYSRATLNLGHTFAHAIETLPSISPTQMTEDAPLTHGESVGLGLIAAAATSQSLGMIEREHVKQITSYVHAAGLPCSVQGLPDSSTLITRMLGDKKSTRGTIQLILPVTDSQGHLGQCTIVSDPSASSLRRGWEAITV